MYPQRVTLLLIIIITNSYCTQIKKCCEPNENLEVFNTSDFRCVDNARLQMQVESSAAFLSNGTDGFCVDGSENQFSNFTILNGKIILKETLKIKPFAKCCPLNYYYNSKTHACLPSKQNSFKKELFIKVGLPTCRIIIDHQFESMEQLNEKLIELENAGGSCIDSNEKNGFVLRVCEETTEICDSMKCVKKCCPDGQSFVNGSFCTDTFVHGINMSFSKRIVNPDDEFAIVHKYTCKKIYLFAETRYQFELNENGVLKVYYNATKEYKYLDVNMEETYCIEYAKSRKHNGYAFFMCFGTPEEKQKFEVAKWAKVVSCIFLTLTIFVYLALQKTANLFEKSLISYCFAMLFIFTIFAYIQFVRDIPNTACSIFGYASIFATFCGFTWLNVISWDIYSTFGAPKAVYFQKSRDIKKMILYSLYGWGFPILMTFIIFALALSEWLPSAVHPVIGKTKCFIGNDNYASILFKDVPILCLQIINTVFFIKTITYCLRVKNEINRMNDTNSRDRRNKLNADKERLLLIGKLSVIMGLSFTFEVISSFFNMNSNEITKYLEIVWDTINCLQGVFIFLIFICKKQIYLEIRKKLGIAPDRKIANVFNTQLTDTSNSSLRISNKM